MEPDECEVCHWPAALTTLVHGADGTWRCTDCVAALSHPRPAAPRPARVTVIRPDLDDEAYAQLLERQAEDRNEEMLWSRGAYRLPATPEDL